MGLKDKINSLLFGEVGHNMATTQSQEIQFAEASKFVPLTKRVNVLGDLPTQQDVALAAASVHTIKDIDDDQYKYRQLTGGSVPERDLLPYAQVKMIDTAYILYDINPIAKAIVDTVEEFVLGNGLMYEAKDKQVQDVMDRFWNNDVNRLEERQHQFVRELGIYGELFLPVSVGSVNGDVELGYIDPKNVTKVRLSLKNVLVAEIVFAKKLNEASKERKLRIIKRVKDSRRKNFGLLDGNIFLLQVNKMNNSSRGRSDLLSLFDYLDAYDQFMWTRVEKAILQNSIVWDVTLEGYTSAELKQWKKDHPNGPKSGSVIAHNAGEIWKPMTPDFKSSDATPDAKLLLSMIAAGGRIPRHYLSLPEDTNRALGAEMAEPTFKHILVRQRVVKQMFTDMFNFAIDRAVYAGYLAESYKTKKRDFSIILPEISTKSIDKLSRSIERVSKGLEISVKNGFVARETATRILATYSKQLGVDINVNEELAKTKVAQKQNGGLEDDSGRKKGSGGKEE